MRCPACESDNEESAKFCEACGARLARACPGCGREVRPQARFCKECGYELKAAKNSPPIDYSSPRSYTPKHLTEKILTTRSALEGERKLVTVLFADVANYTSMSDRLDPEDVHRIMDGCFRILMEEIHRHEGNINQFTGDGVMALFGAPVAHEDHAQRACRAALAIQRTLDPYGEKIRKEWGLEFRMRIGLNTGPVIVGPIGDDLRMDYTAVGDTTNLAARVQQSAQPGQVWMSSATRGLVRDYFAEEAVGELTLKGKSEPQPLYRLLSERAGVRTRFDAGLVRGVTAFVGREPEMEALRSAYNRAKGGEAELVDVVGEAGVGKSRLVYEFQKTLGAEATVLTGTCLQYGRNINFHPVIELVGKAFGIEEGMGESEANRRVQEIASGGDGLTPFVGFYQSLLSLPVTDARFNGLNPEGLKFGTFEAVKSLLAALSEKKPLVLLLEDVHWIDKISEELFTYVSRSVLDHPILLISTYRPEVCPAWAQGPCYQRLGLQTLSTQLGARLLRNVLGGLPIEPALERRIVEHAGGNPFFVEEITRELIERGDLTREGDRYVCAKPIEQCQIPDTVQGVLAARLDRLSEDLKRTLQVASVIGRDFAFRLLKTILELGDELRNHLTNLVGLEILYEKALYPELEYIFKHALTQEVAYESLLKQRRKELHGRIAKTIEELHAHKLEPHYELLAHHWELSDRPERAIEYLVLAGEKQRRRGAADGAVHFFSHALGQVERSGGPPDPCLVMRIRGARAAPLFYMGKIEECVQDHREVIRLGREMGDEQSVLGSLLELSEFTLFMTYKDELPRICEEGLRLARALRNKGAEVQFMTNHMYWRGAWNLIPLEGGLEQGRRIYELAQQSGQAEAIFRIRWTLGVVERLIGNAHRAVELLDGIVEKLQSMYNLSACTNIVMVRGQALTELGQYTEAIHLQNRWIEIMEQNCLYLRLGSIYNGLAWAYSEIYDIDTAHKLNQKSLDCISFLQINPANLYLSKKMEAQTRVNLMENAFDLGNADEAFRQIVQFEDISAHPDYDFVRWRWAMRMKELKGRILMGRGDLEGAEKIARDCLDGASQSLARKYVGKAQRLLGQVMTQRGAYGHAEAHLQSALQELERVGNPKQLWITRTALARLYQAMNRADREREHWQAAAAIVRSTAEGLPDASLRHTFLDAAPVREILENEHP